MTRIKKRRTGKKRTSDLKKASAGRRGARPKTNRPEGEVAEATEKKIRSYTKRAKPDKPDAPKKSARTEKTAAPKKVRTSGRVRPARSTDRVKAKPKPQPKTKPKS